MRIKDFMRQLFESRIAEEKRILVDREIYRKTFFSQECTWDDRRFNLEMLESERIVGIETLDSETKVITEYKASVSPLSVQTNHRRYHLVFVEGSLKISHVDRQCPLCHGKGKDECISCKGKHWI